MRYLLNFGDYSFFVDSNTGESLSVGDSATMEGEDYKVSNIRKYQDRIEVRLT